MRKRQEGVSELVGVLILAALAGAWIAWESQQLAAQTQYARGRAAGGVFASWMLGAHRRAQEEGPFYETALGTVQGVAIAQATLETEGLVPAWLSRETILDQAIALGVVDDGAGVPMAFAVAAPGRRLSLRELQGFRAGAAAGGVVGVEALGTQLGAETFSGNRQAGMEQALGRSLAAGDLAAVADLGIVYDERLVYRRRQPGREYLSEMLTELEFAAGSGIVDVGTVFSETWESSQDFVVGREGAIGGDLLAGLAGGSARVEGSVVQGAVRFTTVTGLEAETWTVNGTVVAQEGRVSGSIQAADVTGVSSVEGGPVLAVEGDLVATAVVQGGTISGSTVLGRGGGWAADVQGTSTVRGDYTVGDSLRVTGTLSVGSCYGCSL